MGLNCKRKEASIHKLFSATLGALKVWTCYLAKSSAAVTINPIIRTTWLLPLTPKVTHIEAATANQIKYPPLDNTLLDQVLPHHSYNQREGG